MLVFVTYQTPLAQRINKVGTYLYNTLQDVHVDSLQLNEHGVEYFNKSHKQRLFFSIQTSAHILYQSITISKKKVEDIVLMDYGAGLGSLYLLATLLGCKKVIYNDLLEYWKYNAQQLSVHIGINVHEYIVGDIDATMLQLQQQQTVVDIITTRNVIEHIYYLPSFYSTIQQHQPQAIIFSSTTANFYNPAMNVQHVLLHKKVEKYYLAQRIQFIKNYNTQLSSITVKKIATLTRGYCSSNLPQAIDGFVHHNQIPPKKYYYTNTCNVEHGVWAENILPYHLHKKFINQQHYIATVQPGFWDTHYTTSWKNTLGNVFNWCIEIHPFFGFLLAPFVYVVAVPKSIASA